MAKRFTDTDKWKRPWFSDLPIIAKLVWIYLLDDCDHRGVWLINFKRLSYDIGENVADDNLKSWFGEKLKKIDDDKYFIESFVKFQYKELNSTNNAHIGVISLLSQIGAHHLIKKEGAHEDLGRGYPAPQDKDKVKVKVKEKDKVKEQEGFKEKEVLVQKPNSAQRQEDLFSKESQRIRSWLKEKKLLGLQSHMILIKDRFGTLEGLEKEYLEFRESYLNSCRTSGKPTSEQAARQYVAGAILKHIGVR